MHSGQFVFSQVMDHVPSEAIDRDCAHIFL